MPIFVRSAALGREGNKFYKFYFNCLRRGLYSDIKVVLLTNLNIGAHCKVLNSPISGFSNGTCATEG
jgi:hypothetical protein